MTAKFSALKTHFTHWREWELNPIVIKELRQAVRSQILTGMLLLLLVMLFLASVASLTGQNILMGGASEMGQGMFNTCLVVLAITSLLFIPLYTGIRLAVERNRSDLIFFTPLPVTVLVHGKLLSGVCLAILFFSVCLPFMTFSSLLPGLDFITVQFVLSFLFAAICVAIFGAVGIASLPFGVILKTLFGLAFAGALTVGCGFLLGFLFSVVASGAPALMQNSHFWAGLMEAFGIAAFAVTAFYGLAISFITNHRCPEDPYYLEVKPPHD